MAYNPYPNPYGGRAGPALSATQGFLTAFQQEREYLRRDQYYQSLVDYRRSSAERGQERLGFERQRVGFEERRLKLTERRETRLGEEPEKYSTEWFKSTLGYSPETAQILQDRRFGAAPKLRSPTELVRDARTAHMTNAATTYAAVAIPEKLAAVVLLPVA